jgi:hypothetical protein
VNAFTSGLQNMGDTNYGVDDPLENAERPMIGNTPVMNRPGWKWVRDATSVSGWKVVPTEPTETSGGGGSDSNSNTGGAGTGAGGGGDPQEGDPWIWNGQVLVNVNTGDEQEVPNPGRLEEGVVYNQDAEPVGDAENTDDEGTLVAGYGGNLGDWIIGGGIGGAVGQGVGGSGSSGGSGSGTGGGTGGYGVTVTPNPSPSPGVNTGGTQNGMGGDGGQNTGQQGSGSDGSGDGNGGDGTGQGPGGAQPANAGLFGAGGGSSDLFPYTAVRPSKAAQLSGMIDYVMALLKD